MVKAGEDLKIPVLDHVIIGKDGKFTSLLGEGFIKASAVGGSDSKMKGEAWVKGNSGEGVLQTKVRK